MDYRLITVNDLSPSQLIVAHRNRLLWAKRWERCPACNQYLAEELPNWAKCTNPEKHGVKK